MNLSDCLLNQEVSVLKDLASAYECDCNQNSKLEMVQAVYHRLLHKRSCRIQMEEMSEEGFHFLTYVLFQRQSAFTMSSLLAKGKRVASLLDWNGSPKTWLTDIIRKGWLYPQQNGGQTKWVIPTDLHAALRRECKQVWLYKESISPVELHPTVIRDEENLLFADVSVWLQFVHDEYIPLTKHGVMFKRTQKQLLERLHILEEPLAEKEWRFGYGRRFPFYPNRFAFIYDFSYEQGWVTEGMGELYLTRDGLKRVGRGNVPWSESERQECLRFWLRTYQKPIPALAFLVRWMFFTFLEQWIEVERLYEIVSPWFTAFYFDDHRNVFDVRIMHMLSHLGLVQTAYAEQYGMWLVRKHPQVTDKLLF